MSNLISASVQRRVVGSATRKSVLLYMADKAADDGTGIWTSKANIARDLELSRRAVQIAIQELIRDGLVKEAGQRDCKHGFTIEYAIESQAVDNLPSTREQPVDNSSRTREQGSPRESSARVTRERGSPHPVNQIHPNHPYRDTTTQLTDDPPVDNSDPQARCLAVAGPGLCPASRTAIIETAEVIEGWLREGMDIDADILPVIRARTPTIRISPIRTWAYFTDAVRAAHRQRLRQPARPQGAEKAGAPANPQLQFFADWVNSDRYLPANAISNAIALTLLEAGLTSVERLAQRGIPVPARKDRP
ncbi:Helix-turn-helix domain-containing protein [Paracoccus thiocyanatus]|uniref:Helix-turn-helix domain-containing protein n=1 Tax=Paracoccus thiocyanatus TaxID=34006 RepID=A0A1N6Y3U5_9RHOB|nr:helix-turn-helix domain-containing protein [Paracoccus thiocyanatus]SIR09238.1 Helix-turn-helix domain-containing protein [Paracoccus thiocyanatus]